MAEKSKKELQQPTKGGIAYVALVKAADRIKNRMEKIFVPFDITGQQYNVLRILRGAEPEGLPTLTVAERMVEQTPGITRMIDRLESKGLVSREIRLEDRRCVYCRISQKGLDLLAALDDLVDVTNDALDGLTDKEIEQMTKLLEKLVKSLEQN